MNKDNRHINICYIDRILRVILGVILIAICYVFPLVPESTGKIIISLIGVALIIMALIKKCPVNSSESCGLDN